MKEKFITIIYECFAPTLPMQITTEGMQSLKPLQ